MGFGPSEITYQPNGSRRHPDYDVAGHYLENKSTEGYAPMWNEHRPRVDTIYEITSKRHNATLCAFGADIMSNKVRAIFDKGYERLAIVRDQINQELAAELSPSGKPNQFRYGIRPEVNQVGGIDICDLFSIKEWLTEQCLQRLNS